MYAIFNDQNFNDLLTNDIVSFEQLGPVGEKKNQFDQSLQYVLCVDADSVKLRQDVHRQWPVSTYDMDLPLSHIGLIRL